MIAIRLQKLRQELGKVTLVAVTKNRSAQDILELLGLGVKDIAENQLQEAEEKFSTLIGNPLFEQCTKHFIGRLQSNKINRIVQLFDVIQSIDSLKAAEQCSRAAQTYNKTIEVFLQVNATGEKQKQGILPEHAAALAGQISQLSNLVLVGIMGMGPQATVPSIRTCFRTLASVQKLCNLFQLSMGMSNDYALACEEGATMVRIGSFLFE